MYIYRAAHTPRNRERESGRERDTDKNSVWERGRTRASPTAIARARQSVRAREMMGEKWWESEKGTARRVTRHTHTYARACAHYLTHIHTLTDA